MSSDTPNFTSRELREVLGAFVTGVTAITTCDAAGTPHGVTANSFSSVSLDPPLVLWSQSLAAFSHPVFREADRFVVNVLADDQIEISNRFARAGEDKFGRTRVRSGIAGLPLIEGCSAYLECRCVDARLAGDHMIFIGQVERIERTAARPLVFGSGQYLIAQPHDFGRVSAGQQALNRVRLKAVRMATHAAVELARELDATIGVGVWANHGPTIVHWEMPEHPVSVNLRVGAVLPVVGSATGLLFTAWLPREETEAFVVAELASRAGIGSPQANDRGSLDARLAQVRRTGVSQATTVSRFVDQDEVTVDSASVPVFDQAGNLMLALTVLAEHGRLAVGAGAPVLQALTACADLLSRRFGGRRPVKVDA